MSDRLREMPKDYSEDASKDVVLKIPALTLSTLISMVAIGKWVICDGSQDENPGLRRAAAFMEQLVYEQSYQEAGPDEVWKDPSDASFHHPTFPEQEGEAWKALGSYEDEFFAMRLIEMASRILAERGEHPQMSPADRADHYEHLLMDLMEAEGVEGVLKNLIS